MAKMPEHLVLLQKLQDEHMQSVLTEQKSKEECARVQLEAAKGMLEAANTTVATVKYTLEIERLKLEYVRAQLQRDRNPFATS